MVLGVSLPKRDRGRLRVRRRIQAAVYGRDQHDLLGEAGIGLVEARGDVAPMRMSDQDRVLEIQMIDDALEVVGVLLVGEPGRLRLVAAALAALVVDHHEVAPVRQRLGGGELEIPAVKARPAVYEDDRRLLGIAVSLEIEPFEGRLARLRGR
jgi:hypothetical protein